MPNPILIAMNAARRAFYDFLRPSPILAHQPRPAWHDGTDYDIPTFIRRRADHSHTSTVPVRRASAVSAGR